MSGYDPVSDFLTQTGLDEGDLSDSELALLKTLNKHEVDALVSIDNKGKHHSTLARVGSIAY